MSNLDKASAVPSNPRLSTTAIVILVNSYCISMQNFTQTYIVGCIHFSATWNVKVAKKALHVSYFLNTQKVLCLTKMFSLIIKVHLWYNYFFVEILIDRKACLLIVWASNQNVNLWYVQGIQQLWYINNIIWLYTCN